MKRQVQQRIQRVKIDRKKALDKLPRRNTWEARYTTKGWRIDSKPIKWTSKFLV